MEAAEVERGDGHWSAGYQFDSVGCVLHSIISDVCTPARGTLSGTNDPAATSSGRNAYVFGVVTSMRGRARCSSGLEPKWVADALDAETEKAAGEVLFGGNGGAADVYLTKGEVATVASGTTTPATVAAALAKFWTLATGVKQEDTILHLGIGSALGMVNLIDGDYLYGTKIKVSVSEGYGVNVVAVTGPVTIRVGDNQVVAVPDTKNNDLNNEATRLVAVEFDPCIAVRAT
jgi:hypothetical protein